MHLFLKSKVTIVILTLFYILAAETRSFLQILIENTVTLEGSVFTDHQLRCLCDNVLLAGFDTSTYEIIFTLVCIGSDEDVQDKIYQEWVPTSAGTANYWGIKILSSRLQHLYRTYTGC